jgi:hypothetical protein
MPPTSPQRSHARSEAAGLAERKRSNPVPDDPGGSETARASRSDWHGITLVLGTTRAKLGREPESSPGHQPGGRATPGRAAQPTRRPLAATARPPQAATGATVRRRWVGRRRSRGICPPREPKASRASTASGKQPCGAPAPHTDVEDQWGHSPTTKWGWGPTTRERRRPHRAGPQRPMPPQGRVGTAQRCGSTREQEERERPQWPRHHITIDDAWGIQYCGFPERARSSGWASSERSDTPAVLAGVAGASPGLRLRIRRCERSDTPAVLAGVAGAVEPLWFPFAMVFPSLWFPFAFRTTTL